MASLYALNLTFDPAGSTGLFQPFDSSNNSGRAWAVSTDNGATWAFAGNPDTYAPELDLADLDRVQFAVSATSAPAAGLSTVALTVIFSTDRGAANNPARIASPFQLTNGNPRCVLNDPPTRFTDPLTGTVWFFIGPYSLGVNQSNSGSGKLKFEFAIAAHVTFGDGTVKDYGYDPEMDVDV